MVQTYVTTISIKDFIYKYFFQKPNLEFSEFLSHQFCVYKVILAVEESICIPFCV